MKQIQKGTAFFVGFCISFYSVTIPLGRPMSLSVLSMILYAIALFPYWAEFFKIKRTYGNVFIMPLYFIIFLTFVNCFYTSQYATPIFNTTLLLCVLLFCLLLIHVKHDFSAMRVCAWGLAFGGALLAIFAIMGIGVEIEPTEMRLRVFGINANTVGIIMSISFIIIVNEFIILDAFKLRALKFSFILILIPVLSTLLLTGSRTALFIVGLSAVSAVILYPSRNRMAKILVLISGAISLTYIIYSFLQSESIMVERFLDFMENKDISGRDDIWIGYVPYILASPLWGYGETGFAVISNNVVGFLMIDDKGYAYGFSPHNVIVELLMLTGVIGLTMWAIFWKKIFKSAWICYRSYAEMTPLILTLPILASIMSGQILLTTHGYILYAYIYSESCRLNGKII